MAKSAQGSTVKFPTTATTDVLGSVRSITFTNGGQDIDLSHLSSASKVYEPGLDDPEVTIELLGGISTSVARGQTGVVTIAWNSGETDSIASVYVSNTETSGETDGEISSSLTFKPLST